MNSEQSDFSAKFDVSRETIEKLEIYADLLRKWTPSINLVSKTTISTLWKRHFADSAQILAVTNIKSGRWLDIGAGGGFPGLVLAIICQEKRPGIQFSLVESDIRKSVFLRTVARELQIQTKIINERVEQLDPMGADVVSARALAPLPKLLGFAERHLNPNGRAIFQKGEKYQQEIEDALEVWSFTTQKYPSITDSNAAILSLGEITRV